MLRMKRKHFLATGQIPQLYDAAIVGRKQTTPKSGNGLHATAFLPGDLLPDRDTGGLRGRFLTGRRHGFVACVPLLARPAVPSLQQARVDKPSVALKKHRFVRH